MAGAPIQVDADFYLDPLVVQNTLLKVPRAIFNGSPVFESMFSLPQSRDGTTDGSDDSHPLKLDSIALKDFKLFVRAAASLLFNTGLPNLSLSEWKPLLSLSTMWEVEPLRALIVSQLSATFKNEDAAEQIQLAQLYGIANWVERSMQVLVPRLESMTAREIEFVGPERAAQIWSLRDRNRGIAVHQSIAEVHRKRWDIIAQTGVICQCKGCKYIKVEDFDYSVMMPEIANEIKMICQREAASES